jgi:hypothetical protein
VCKILEGKRPLGRPRRGWKNIKTDLKEIGFEVIDWINLAQDMDGNEPSSSRKFWKFLEYLNSC